MVGLRNTLKLLLQFRALLDTGENLHPCPDFSKTQIFSQVLI